MGTVYALIIVVTMLDAWTYYIFLGVVEVVLTLPIGWYASTWPKRAVQPVETRPGTR